ncbi:ankyrin repeat-containing domain, PGG domain, Gag-polypeptide of LTR copia-type [Artemisia annua]|uniref:Ankyrin repeat-containing domain, PGG domain, Gag-polypeptide of LTR copia-type n=1 Tax=Artemisia annua TaxID=35608 RepID=A0A2U1NCZ4_ARTAN|nr:ankyrin repeat-containing domain, PGG domain, Gag-polypeptide of LTR copia-type [Artemisia annua]
MAGTLNSLHASERVQDLEYLYASIVNLSNFVSVKLSSDRNYHLWKTQMLCLMKSHNMAGIVDDAYVRPRTSSKEIMDQYDSLLKGWIFGSASENVLGAVVDLPSAKDVWDQLKSFYDVTVSNQQVYSALTKSGGEIEAEAETNTETKDVDVISSQTGTNVGDALAIAVVSTETKTEGSDPDNRTETKKSLREATMKGDWTGADSILKQDKDLVRVAISSDGSTILHIAVGIAELLLTKKKECLRIKDRKGKEPLHKAYENMHLDTIGYLLKVIEDDRKSEDSVHPHPGDEMGVDLLVNVISARQYNLASELIKKFPKFASKNDDVLMAIAKTFPIGDHGDTYSVSWKLLWKAICHIVKELMSLQFLRSFLMEEWNGPSSLILMGKHDFRLAY